MMMLLALAVAGAGLGMLVARLMRDGVALGRIAALPGVFGALAAASSIQWAQLGGAEGVLLPFVSAVGGAVLATFATLLIVQHRTPGALVAARLPEPRVVRPRPIAIAADGTTLRHAHRASAATRLDPLLVLHRAHTMRCWPVDRLATTATDEPLHWTVEVDGGAEYAGPDTRRTSDSTQVAFAIRQWWDARELIAR